MPLVKGTSRAVIEHNIHEMVAHNHPVKQAVAAALHTAHPQGGKAKDEVAMSAAEVNRKNEQWWGNVGPAKSEAEAPMLAGTKVASVPVWHGAGVGDEVEPTQSAPPDKRSDNLLERAHGGIPGTEPLTSGTVPNPMSGDESLVEWAKEEEKEKEHEKDELAKNTEAMPPSEQAGDGIASNVHAAAQAGRVVGEKVAQGEPPIGDEHLGFQKLKGELAHKKGIRNPAAVAAKIGMEKYGKKGMEAKAHHGDESAPPKPSEQMAQTKKLGLPAPVKSEWARRNT
jgi:hypothetical protein